MRAIYAIFVISGISGLIYQVVWVRWFGRLFGNTVYSASLVIAVFMAGLGIGSYLVGRWIDKNAGENPLTALKAYALAELAIASLGAGIAFLLPALEPLAAMLTRYSADANGWYEPSLLSFASRFGVAVLILAPSTILMGGTLTLLVRYLLAAGTDLAGWRIGFLYGFNTAGAALGAFATDFFLVPSFGLGASQFFAVLCNLLAALATFSLVKREHGAALARSADAPTPPSPTPSPVAPPDPLEPRKGADTSHTAIVWTSAAICFSGFCAMGVELLWFRQFSIAMGAHRAVFSLLLTVVLVGIWLGSLLGGAMQRRYGRPILLYALAQAAFVITVMLLLATLDMERGTSLVVAEEYERSISTRLSAGWVLLEPMVAIVFLPALLMGFSYPLANANIQRAESSIGRRAGVLYLANTAGAVLGSLLTGFLLIPALGLKGGMVVVALGGLAAIVALFRAGAGSGTHKRVVAASAAVVLVAIVGWTQIDNARFTMYGTPPGSNVLEVSEGLYELIAVTDTGNGRVLRTNGHPMSGTNRLTQRYMRAFAHLPLLQREQPRRALVICFGVGTTLNAVSLHSSLERIEIADLSRHVLSKAHYFVDSNHDVLHDPRVAVFINDGRQHLWMSPEGTFDLITLEPPPISFAGVSALYSREFYQLARSRLQEGGFMSQWLPAYQLPEHAVLSLVRAFVDVFPNAILVQGFGKELILIGSRSDAPITIDPAVLQARLEQNPAVLEDLRRVGLGSVTKIIGSFVSGPENLERATQGVHPVTDDFPVMEYAAPATTCYRTRFPIGLIDEVGAVSSWCPTCLQDGAEHPAVPGLLRYLRALQHINVSDDFLNDLTCKRPLSAEELAELE